MISAGRLTGGITFEGTKLNRVEIIIDGVLGNDADFQPKGGSSMMLVDTSATTITGGGLKSARATGKIGSIVRSKNDLGEFFLNRNMTLTIAVRVGANNTDVDAAISWAEDV